MEDIIISLDVGGFTVQQGERYADSICYEEALGLIAHLMSKAYPTNIYLRFESWMKTKAQYDAQEARWKQICEENRKIIFEPNDPLDE